MERIVIGSELGSRYFLKANYNDTVVLAQHSNPAVPEPFVVWYLDEDGSLQLLKKQSSTMHLIIS